MKKSLIFFVSAILLFSFINFISAKSITSSITQNESNYDDSDNETSDNRDDKDDNEDKNKTREKIKNIIKEKNKLRAGVLNGTCPDNCTCSGSTIKCILPNGAREMTIYAGNSGNIIIQIKGENMTTNVTLYKSNNTIVGVFKNNETKIIKYFPDQVKEKIREKLKSKLETQNITLDEDGFYRIETKKKSRLFYLFPVKEKVVIRMDPETGEMIKTRTSWWGFLAKDEKEENLVGGSCGTVTPGMNDECCKNKGYDLWNSEKGECEFEESEE